VTIVPTKDETLRRRAGGREDVRCPACGRLLCRTTPEGVAAGHFRCHRCKGEFVVRVGLGTLGRASLGLAERRGPCGP
jgi:transposase-like protein